VSDAFRQQQRSAFYAFTQQQWSTAAAGKADADGIGCKTDNTGEAADLEQTFSQYGVLCCE